jgi:hypothetical protein
MLRFNTKNLSYTSKQRLTEGVEPIITPHFTHHSGITFRTPFKTTSQMVAFTTPPPLGVQATDSDGNQKIDPNETSLINDYYYYAGAILKKVALAGKYNPADYKTPEIFRDYIFNTDVEATNNTNDYDNIQCSSGGHGNSKTLNSVYELLKFNIIDEEAYNRANPSKEPVPGQSLTNSSKYFSGWNTMLATLNSAIPTRFATVNADPGINWQKADHKINVNN